jgi:hypothetical protein
MRTIVIPGQDLSEVASHLGQSADGHAGIVVHLYTSIYINENEVDPRLGMNTEVHEPVTLLTISQTTLDYISRCPHPSSSHER